MVVRGGFRVAHRSAGLKWLGILVDSRSISRVWKGIWRSLISAGSAGLSTSGLFRPRGIPSGHPSLWMSKKLSSPAQSIGSHGRAPGATTKKSYVNASEVPVSPEFHNYFTACTRRDR